MRMICCLPGVFLIMTLLGASPYEGGIPPDPNLKINAILRSGWKEKNIAPPETASDAVFLRRVYLTVAGRLPTIAEARRFLADKSQDKRAKLIDSLLASPEYADLLAMRFADMLRIKSEFPINLWPNAVQAWHRQIRAELLADRSYQEMAPGYADRFRKQFPYPARKFFPCIRRPFSTGTGKSSRADLHRYPAGEPAGGGTEAFCRILLAHPLQKHV